MTDRDVLSLVWGETNNVTPKGGNAQESERLHAVVAKLAGQISKRGLEQKLCALAAPRVGTPEAGRYLIMKETVNKVETGIYGGPVLPARAALVEITPTGAPRLDTPLPKALSWVLDADVYGTGEYVVGDGSDGRVYRLLESEKEPNDGELPFVSTVTGSGLPVPVVSNPYKKFAWFLGIAATVIFIAGGAMSISAGRVVIDAKNILKATHPASQYELLSNVVGICISDASQFVFAKPSVACTKVLDNGITPPRYALSDTNDTVGALKDAIECKTKPESEGCGTILRAAIAAVEDRPLIKDAVSVTQSSVADKKETHSTTGSSSILVPYLMLVVGIAGLIIALGLGTKQRVAGVWIDTRNRISLARAQVTLWTVVALAGYAAFGLFRIGYGDFEFPQIPASIAAALGISVVSPMISALILPKKNSANNDTGLRIIEGESDPRKRGTPFFGAQSDGLSTNESPQSASIADMFMGEEKVNADTVDVSRLQNVVITIVLVLGYFAALLEVTSTPAITMLASLEITNTPLGPLPDLGETFASLLFVSHATYLIAKAHDSRPLSTSETSDN